MTATETITGTTELNGHSLTIEDVARIARHREKIELAPGSSHAGIEKCRSLLERKIASREVMYGVNTGIGELATVVLSPEQAEQFQRYLLYSHAAGFGDPCSEEDARAGILSAAEYALLGAFGHSFGDRGRPRSKC